MQNYLLQYNIKHARMGYEKHQVAKYENAENQGCNMISFKQNPSQLGGPPTGEAGIFQKDMFQNVCFQFLIYAALGSGLSIQIVCFRKSVPGMVF